MLIRYFYGDIEDNKLFYFNKSIAVPRVGETIIFDTESKDFYKNCYFDMGVDSNGDWVETDEYVIDNIDAYVFVVTDVCYNINNEETYVDVIVNDALKQSDNEDYLKNLAKDVNIPNDYNR